MFNLFSTKKDAITAIDLLLNNDLTIDQWMELKKDMESYKDHGLADRVLDYFNEVNDTRYANTDKIKSIIRQIPKITFEHFQSVILHKKEKWGDDPMMKEYLRPGTLFGSKNKFMNYLEDAREFWILKSKQNART